MEQTPTKAKDKTDRTKATGHATDLAEKRNNQCNPALPHDTTLQCQSKQLLSRDRVLQPPPLVQITLSEVCDQNDDSGCSRDLRIASTSRFFSPALCDDFECSPKSLRPLHGSPRAPVDHLNCRGVPSYNSVNKRSCNAQKERGDLRRLRRLRRTFAEMK